MIERTVLTIITGVVIILMGAFIILIKPPNKVTTAIVRVFCDDAEMQIVGHDSPTDCKP